jgi:hypothetical protein
MMSIFFCGLMIATLIGIAAKANLNLFLLTGAISGRNGQLVYLIRDDHKDCPEVLCSVAIQHNVFRLSCQVAAVQSAYLIIGEGKDEIRYPITIDQGHFSFSEAQDTYLFKTA